MASRLIVLFDIDLTLIDFRLNRETLSCALDVATGVSGLLDQMDWRGSTDRWLADEAARIAELASDGLHERFADAYTRILGENLATLQSSVLPGSAALLENLASEHDATLGISTGNTRRNAVLKLEHAELAGYFDPLRGGFGDDLDDRVDIVRAAAEACGRGAGDRLVVVGDTVRDVRAALASDAVAIGVATGASTVEELQAAGATVALPGLGNRDTALAAILGS